MWLLASACAFVAGVAIAATHEPLWMVALGPAVAFAFLMCACSRATIAVLVACVVASGFLGAARYADSLPENPESLVSSLNDTGDILLTGVVSDEPDGGGRYTNILLDNVVVEATGEMLPLSGRVRVTTGDPAPLHFGDTVSCRGRLQTPSQLGEFDYAAYLSHQGVYSTMFCRAVDLLTTETGWTPKKALLDLNSRLGSALARALPEPESSLAQLLLLGRSGRLPDTIVDAFRSTGTAHLLSISGLHLGIVVAAALAALLAVLGRRHYLYVWLGLVALWTYALFAGMKPPVVRAAIMLSLFLLAELAGRQKHAPTALAAAAAVMVGIEPRVLWQVSFQLSVLAMGGLVLLYGPLKEFLVRYAEWVERRWSVPLTRAGTVLDITAATVAATLAVWPVSAGTFGQVSMVAIPASLPTIPLLPFALAASSVAAATSLVSPVLAAPFAGVAWLFLSCIIGAVEAFAAIPGATIAVSEVHPWLIAAYYGVLVAIPVVWQRRRKRREEERPPHQPTDEPRPGRLRWCLPPAVLAAALVWSAVLCAPDGRLHVIFLDVGQGDSALVITPSGRTVLIDGGPDGRETCALVDRYLPFWDRSLDAVVATHPHADHLGGLLTAVDRYGVGAVLASPVELDSADTAEWVRRLASAGLASTTVFAGKKLLLGDGTSLSVLNPPAGELRGTANDVDNNGLVLYLSYEDVSFLFAADIRAEAEAALVHRGAGLRCNVLKVPHHGSDTSSSDRFVAAVDPDIAVVSVGAENSYGHPHPDTLKRLTAGGAAVMTTAERGNVEFVTDGHTLSVRTER